MITKTDRGFKLLLFIQPKSSKNEIVGLHNGALKIKLTAPPVDGKANAALISFLAEVLQTPRRNLEILHGETGRHKAVLVTELAETDIRERLGL